MQPNRSNPDDLQHRRPPHAATVAQPKPAPAASSARPPHAATVAQPKPAPAASSARPPHPAKVAQPKPAMRALDAHGPHPATVSPTTVQAKLALRGATPVPRVAQARPLYSHRVTAEQLQAMSTDMFVRAKAVANKVMEVQVSKLMGKYCFSSNTTGAGNDTAPLTAAIDEDAATFDGKRVTKAQIKHVTGIYHAEQNLLYELAKILQKGTNLPQNVFVVGSKKPCTVCRRVLRAFRDALVLHYPAVSLHFVDESGQTTDTEAVSALDISAIADGTTATFAPFKAAYVTAQGLQAAYPNLPGENLSSGTRMGNPIDFDNLT